MLIECLFNRIMLRLLLYNTSIFVQEVVESWELYEEKMESMKELLDTTQRSLVDEGYDTLTGSQLEDLLNKSQDTSLQVRKQGLSCWSSLIFCLGQMADDSVWNALGDSYTLLSETGHKHDKHDTGNTRM